MNYFNQHGHKEQDEVKDKVSSNKVKTDTSRRKDYFLIVISIHKANIIKKKSD